MIANSSRTDNHALEKTQPSPLLVDVSIESTELTPRELDKVVLPPKQGIWSRAWKHPYLFHYNRFAAVVIAVNFAIAYLFSDSFRSLPGLEIIGNLVLVNIAIAVFMRSQYLINLFFKIATSAPTSWPLYIRSHLAKVYHFGGFHVGSAISATAWFSLFSAGIVLNYIDGNLEYSKNYVILTGAILILLLSIFTMALPPIRAKYHNQFELVLRFGGWSLLALVWIHTVLGIQSHSANSLTIVDYFSQWQISLLALITASIAAPWIRLRRVPVSITTPSNHVALAKFDFGETPFAGSSTSISRNPLLEWHSFANVPSPKEDGFRLTISRAGDWTGRFVEDRPSHVWVKGITTAGVANIEVLFKRVVYLATGSGIGPCLPHLLEGKVPSLLVWSTRSPRKTYGDSLVNEILASQPNAIIWDTSVQGKPDMIKLAYHAVQEFDAEAVICISNKSLTFKVKQELESRNIPTYGAIWDS